MFRCKFSPNVCADGDGDDVRVSYRMYCKIQLLTRDSYHSCAAKYLCFHIKLRRLLGEEPEPQLSAQPRIQLIHPEHILPTNRIPQAFVFLIWLKPCLHFLLDP